MGIKAAINLAPGDMVVRNGKFLEITSVEPMPNYNRMRIRLSNGKKEEYRIDAKVKVE